MSSLVTSKEGTEGRTSYGFGNARSTMRTPHTLNATSGRIGTATSSTASIRIIRDFTRTSPPTWCDVCGVELVTGDQVVGTGVAPTPYRHAVCNALGYRAPDVPVTDTP